MNNIFHVAFINTQTATLVELLTYFKSFCELQWDGQNVYEKNWNELRQLIEGEKRSLAEFYQMLQYLSDYKKEGLFHWPAFDLKSCFLGFESGFFYGSSKEINKKMKPYLIKLKNRDVQFVYPLAA